MNSKPFLVAMMGPSCSLQGSHFDYFCCFFKVKDYNWPDYIKDYKLLLNIFQEFEIDTKVELSINDFLDNQHRLEIFHGFDKQKDKKMRLSFLSPEPLEGKKVALIFLLCLQIGNYRFGYLYTSESEFEALAPINHRGHNFEFEANNFATTKFSYRRTKQAEQELLDEIENLKTQSLRLFRQLELRA